MKKAIDLNKLLTEMSENEVKLIGQTLVWKHGGNLAVTIVDLNDEGGNEADMSVLMWQTGKKKALSSDEEELFRKYVTGYYNSICSKITFGEEISFFERGRKSDIIG